MISIGSLSCLVATGHMACWLSTCPDWHRSRSRLCHRAPHQDADLDRGPVDPHASESNARYAKQTLRQRDGKGLALRLTFGSAKSPRGAAERESSTSSGRPGGQGDSGDGPAAALPRRVRPHHGAARVETLTSALSYRSPRWHAPGSSRRGSCPGTAGGNPPRSRSRRQAAISVVIRP